MRDEVDVCPSSRIGYDVSDGQAAASGEVGLDDVDTTLRDEALELPPGSKLLPGRDRHRTGPPHGRVLIEPFGMNEVFDPADAIIFEPLAETDGIALAARSSGAGPPGG